MKKTEKATLKVKLLSAFKKVVKENKAYLSNKAEKLLEKSIGKIVKKTSQKRKTTLKSKTHASIVKVHKYVLTAANGVKPSKQTI
ncbi:MAG: hypothetical protein JJE09_08650 [Bacteroidia bacterium]|nr:hypothetical protein [Bacteroidia bacterium]